MILRPSSVSGFDPVFVAQPGKDKLLGYVAQNENYLSEVPLRREVLLRRILDSHPFRLTADRLLAAEALLFGLKDENIRYKIGPASGLATRQGLDYDRIVDAIRAYAKLAQAA